MTSLDNRPERSDKISPFSGGQAVIFAQLVTDHCRFQTIESTQDPNAVPVCDDDLSYWSNATRTRRNPQVPKGKGKVSPPKKLGPKSPAALPTFDQ